MALITAPDKVTGNTMFATEFNEFKAVVNTNRNESDTSLGLRLLKSDDVWGEVPTGTKNGINAVFTIANSNPSKIAVYSDGSRINPTNYSVSGTTLTFTDPGSIPNNSLLIDCIK